jgi:hypothetical protein
MRFVRWIIFGLIVASLGGGLDASDQSNGSSAGQMNPYASKGRTRGDQRGEYFVAVAGGFKGVGTATISTTVSLQAKVSQNGGATGLLVASNLPVKQGYFTGQGTVLGTPCTIHGRVDISTAQDMESTDRQATTGRITGTFKTVDGRVGRLVAVQSRK